MSSEPIDRKQIYRVRREEIGGETLRTDATETGKIIDKWMGFGFASPVIGRLVGVTDRTIRMLRNRDVSKVDREIVRRVEKIEAKDLYRVARDGEFVSAVGVVRRIQAIMVMGHPTRALTGTRQMAYLFMSKQRLSVHMDTHRKYAERYRQLVTQPGDDTRTRRRAIKLGYAGPMSWSADSIDDPWAVPELELDDVLEEVLEEQTLIDEVELGLSMGMNARWIVRDTSIPTAMLLKRLDRAGRGDLATQLRQQLAS